ncbi:hypothetical protein HYE36_05840 [Mycoplasmopsis bovis]|nr:hypothetical protein [Mycoplasmopsis bovis]WHL49537.1 hypothetical protein HYE36_05840 [Mycoplasmopsis bovis]
MLKNDDAARTSIFSDRLSEINVIFSHKFSTNIICISIHDDDAPNERYAKINSLFLRSSVLAYAM